MPHAGGRAFSLAVLQELHCMRVAQLKRRDYENNLPLLPTVAQPEKYNDVVRE
jgi:hypothetical protein